MFRLFKRTIKPVKPAECRAKLPADINDDYYVAEDKIDGCRYMLYLGGDPYKKHKAPNALLSRRMMKNTNTYSDKTFNIPHITDFDYKLKGTVLDGEIFCKDFLTTSAIMGSSSHNAIKRQFQEGLCKYHVFDILFYKGKDVRHLPLIERRELLLQVVEHMSNDCVLPVRQIHTNKQRAFNKIIENGGEGMIIKDLTKPYGHSWAKMKKAYDISAIITGFVNGKGENSELVTSLELSVYSGKKLIKIGRISGLPNKLRHEITQNKRKFRHMVIDLFAQEILASKATAKEPIGKLRHPSFHRIRKDVNKYTITASKLIRDLELNQNEGRKRA